MTAASSGTYSAQTRAIRNSDLLDAAIMGREQTMYQLFDHLRENDPVSRVEHPDYDPFWSLSKYDDIRSIGSQNDRFLSAPRTILTPRAFEKVLIENFGNRNGLETLIHMDRPKHLKLRKVTKEWFLPRSIQRLDAQIRALAKEFVDKMEDLGGECDFVKDIALLYPLRVIMTILGVPPEDESYMLKLTQELFGAQDPTQQRTSVTEEGVGVIMDFFSYFSRIVEDRKANPTDDLATVLANATVDGKPIEMLDQMSYFIITATAGHDTTSATIGGGMKALMEFPAQMQKWRDNPGLGDTAAKELLRWVSPVRHMVRTATDDFDLRGRQIKAGDNIALWYPAANRDPDVFGNPNELDVERNPRLHIAFGYGAHMCLGQHLATLEVERFFGELLPRLKHIEVTAEPSWVEAIFVGGLKSMPVRYAFR